MKRFDLTVIAWLALLLICSAFLISDCAAQCAGGSCGAGGAAAPFGMLRPAVTDWRPAARTDQASTAPRPTPIQAPATKPAEVDPGKLADAILEKLASDPRFRGPPGPKGDTGEPGPAGAQGPAGKDATVDQAAIVAAVLQRIDYQKIASMVTIPGPTTPANEIHYTVVGDESAGYWSRINDLTRYAQDRYAGIRTAAPPANYTGPLPTIVRWTNGSPEYVGRGQYEVEQALNLLAKGESP